MRLLKTRHTLLAQALSSGDDEDGATRIIGQLDAQAHIDTRYAMLQL